ncbi:hypothetical protein TOPH_06280, partial [Tolypocladium ophioglossoides CBS 100239]
QLDPLEEAEVRSGHSVPANGGVRSRTQQQPRTSWAVVHTHECRGCVYRCSQGVSALLVRSRGFILPLSGTIMRTGVQDEPQPGSSTRQRQRRGLLPPEVMELLIPPVKVGAWTGGAGVLAGVGGAIARDTNPLASGVLSGVQWFTLGTSYWFTRTVAMRAWGGGEHMRPVDKTKASAIAGSAAGAVAGLMRGPPKILPAMALWGLVGAGGQVVANRLEAREPRVKDDKDSQFWSKWSPLKKLTDEEYVDMMGEKILKVEADIALIDDRIAELRVAEQTAKEREVQIANSPK